MLWIVWFMIGLGSWVFGWWAGLFAMHYFEVVKK